MELEEVIGEIESLLRKEDRQDVEFRLALVLSQLGGVAKYVTHDPRLNPNARPHGTPEDEAHAFGQLLVQLLAVAVLREVDIDNALELALENWRQQDWRKVSAQPSGPVIRGLSVYQGRLTAQALVDPTLSRLEELSGQILVTRVARPDVTAFLGKISGIVTDHGGLTCHAAIIAREYRIPCVVGTGNATELIADGRIIELDAGSGEVHLI